jgi:hypothetical protein
MKFSIAALMMKYPLGTLWRAKLARNFLAFIYCNAVAKQHLLRVPTADVEKISEIFIILKNILLSNPPAAGVAAAGVAAAGVAAWLARC